ncbi:hypothetical protein AWZ03_012265 [Drosophila navojoa]|uniref:Uncharacterized protein n=1 Tax=Drosophila navojoa TaxID=7232 RepID=A0A484B0G5_DRONA|nr:hypothetical protein AWZ03_012265 [Drosophila navojoa]
MNKANKMLNELVPKDNDVHHRLSPELNVSRLSLLYTERADVPALRDSIYHIDSFVLGAPKSAIFVGLQNDFLCDFAYSLEHEQRKQLDEQLQQQYANQDYNHLEPSNSNSNSNDSNGSNASNSSQDCNYEAQQQQVAPVRVDYDCDYECDYDYDYDCPSNNGPDRRLAYDSACHYKPEQAAQLGEPVQLEAEGNVEQLRAEEHQHAAAAAAEEGDEEEEEAEEEQEEDDEYDDGIGFSCDSDSATVPEDDEFVLVAGHCMALTGARLELPSSSNSYTSSLQCSTPTGTACSSTSTEMDAILPQLTPPPPPAPLQVQQLQLQQLEATGGKAKPKARRGLKFFHKII